MEEVRIVSLVCDTPIGFVPQPYKIFSKYFSSNQLWRVQEVPAKKKKIGEMSTNGKTQELSFLHAIRFLIQTCIPTNYHQKSQSV